MLNLCNSVHEEICFEGRNCPLCETIEEKKDLEKKLDDMQSELDLLKINSGTFNK